MMPRGSRIVIAIRPFAGGSAIDRNRFACELASGNCGSDKGLLAAIGFYASFFDGLARFEREQLGQARLSLASEERQREVGDRNVRHCSGRPWQSALFRGHAGLLECVAVAFRDASRGRSVVWQMKVIGATRCRGLPANPHREIRMIQLYRNEKRVRSAAHPGLTTPRQNNYLEGVAGALLARLLSRHRRSSRVSMIRRCSPCVRACCLAIVPPPSSVLEASAVFSMQILYIGVHRVIGFFLELVHVFLMILHRHFQESLIKLVTGKSANLSTAAFSGAHVRRKVHILAFQRAVSTGRSLLSGPARASCQFFDFIAGRLFLAPAYQLLPPSCRPERLW